MRVVQPASHVQRQMSEIEISLTKQTGSNSMDISHEKGRPGYSVELV